MQNPNWYEKLVKAIAQYQLLDEPQEKKTELKSKPKPKKKWETECVRCGAIRSWRNTHPRLCYACREKKRHRADKENGPQAQYREYLSRGLCEETARILASPYYHSTPICTSRESLGIMKVMYQEFGRYIV